MYFLLCWHLSAINLHSRFTSAIYQHQNKMQHFWTKQISASFFMISSHLCTIFRVTNCQLLRTLCHLHSLILTFSLCHQFQMLPSQPDENKLKMKNGTHGKPKELQSKAKSINNRAMCFPKNTNLTQFLPTKGKKKVV